MTRILALYPNPTDATSWYRGVGVMSHLYKIDPNIRCEMTNLVHWTILKGYDIFFVQRPTLNEHITAIEIAKECNKKIWIDYDDLIWAAHNASIYFKKMKKEMNMTKHMIKENIIKCLVLADVVTVTNNYLRDQLSEYSRNIRVIPNAHDDYFFPINQKNKISDSNIVLWRGSESHKSDLIDFEDQIVRLMENHKDKKFYFYGYKYKCLDKFNNVKFIEPTANVLGYFIRAKQLNPSTVIVPLSDNDFNQSKSNIAAIEANYFGAVAVVPDFNSWEFMGMNYENKEDFFDKTNDLLSMGIIKNKIFDTVSDTIKRNFLLSSVNKGRVEVIRELSNGE
jgi:hypothetical protein